ncbi:unnamed protein product [Caenorhabditis nigoni]|uniref:Uncharacterized protein n=1 Tax=Caenorhabditis nigoni TaxID=1611254 RepID=A0A2G5T458_9PELO|nr:hypothetical protein B9Z55_026542 [Caenorhabditis nigoni]
MALGNLSMLLNHNHELIKTNVFHQHRQQRRPPTSKSLPANLPLLLNNNYTCPTPPQKSSGLFYKALTTWDN